MGGVTVVVGGVVVGSRISASRTGWGSGAHLPARWPPTIKIVPSGRSTALTFVRGNAMGRAGVSQAVVGAIVDRSIVSMVWGLRAVAAPDTPPPIMNRRVAGGVTVVSMCMTAVPSWRSWNCCWPWGVHAPARGAVRVR